MQIETTRLRLRPLILSDYDDLYQLYSDGDVMRYIGKGVRDRQETEISLGKMMSHWAERGFGMWAVHLKENGSFVGRCGLQALAETGAVELGYTFHRAYWRRGLTTEAAAASLQFGFETIGLPRIVAIARPANVGSWKVMEKLGMKYERTGASPYDGSEVVWYGIARDEFRSRRANEHHDKRSE
jgi:ribosomal-protein-alanine N-acetyltransferase